MSRHSARLEKVRERLAPVLEEIAAGTRERERDHVLPYEQVAALVAAGLGRVRVPVELGGDGLSLPELAELLVDLATADSNLPQIFRGHIAYVEDRLVAPPSPERDAWLRRFVDGEIVGNSWSEVGSGQLGRQETVVVEREGRLVVEGRKFYTTGSIFADWTDATARRGEDPVTVLVRTQQEGVAIFDDWDGFGQQLTGTGTIVFDGAEVEPEHVEPFGARFRYQTALYQLVLLSVLAGIAAAAERDLAAQLRARSRVYSHGNASLARHDPQNLAVAGEVSSVAYVARAVVRDVAEALQAAFETAADRDSEADREANRVAELRSAQAQVVLSSLVPQAATVLFNALGASATSREHGLDAHWRNARTVASHNPVIYKAKIVGSWSVNGELPDPVWAIGVDPRAAAVQGATTDGAGLAEGSSAQS